MHFRRSNPASVPSPVAPALRHQVAESSSPVSFEGSVGAVLSTARAQPVALMHPGELSRKALGPRKMSLASRTQRRHKHPSSLHATGWEL